MILSLLQRDRTSDGGSCGQTCAASPLKGVVLLAGLLDCCAYLCISSTHPEPHLLTQSNMPDFVISSLGWILG